MNKQTYMNTNRNKPRSVIAQLGIEVSYLTTPISNMEKSKPPIFKKKSA
jgi:hypothetical protein